MPGSYHAGVKYELQTIPVWDAYEHEADCPLCYLEAKLEADYQNFFLGNAVMAPEMRVEVNRTGFCARHFDLLYRGSNRLGLGLMTKTYLDERSGRFKDARRSVEKTARKGASRKLGKELDSLMDALAAEEETCMICTRLEQSVANYAYTVLSLYKTNEDFQGAFRASRGFCLPHVRTLLRVAPDALSGKDLGAFLTDLFEVHDASTDELSEKLEEMAGRYDYRATERVTEELKESVPRTIEKLVGRFRRQNGP